MPEKKFNPLTQPEEDLKIETPDELQKAKKEASVVDIFGHIRNLKETQDPLFVKEAENIEKKLVEGMPVSEILGGLNLEKLREAWRNLRGFEILAYGGTGYSDRLQTGSWGIDRGYMGDRDGLNPDGTVSFGAGQEKGRVFLIFRQLQDVERRGGYPYTVLLRFSDEILKKAGYNTALIIRNILSNPELKEKLLKNPGTLIVEDFQKLAEVDWSVSSPQASRDIEPILEPAKSKKGVVLKGTEIQRPTPEVMAQALAVLPEEDRASFTYLIDGSRVSFEGYGTKVVWDPNL